MHASKIWVVKSDFNIFRRNKMSCIKVLMSGLSKSACCGNITLISPPSLHSGIDPTSHHGQTEGHQEVPGRHLRQREDHCGGARCRIIVHHVLIWPIKLPTFPMYTSSRSFCHLVVKVVLLRWPWRLKDIYKEKVHHLGKNAYLEDWCGSVAG